MGWAGAVDAVPGFSAQRMVYAGAEQGRAQAVHRGNRSAVSCVRRDWRRDVRGTEEGDSAAGGDEAGELCANAEGKGVRCGAVYAAAGDEYVAGADCECSDAGDAGVAAAVD